MDRDLHNINSDNRQFGLTNITNTYLRKNIIDCPISRNPLKIWHQLTIKYDHYVYHKI